MIFSQYKKTCEVLLDYTKMVGGDIKDYLKNENINLLRAKIDFHSKRLIPELPGDRVKFFSKIQSNCAEK